MKKFQDSSNYISHLRRLASIMNTTRQPTSLHKNYSERRIKPKTRQCYGEKQNKWLEYKQNLRIAESIIKKPGVLNFQRTQEDFKHHLRVRKLRTMFPSKRYKHKQVVIKDIIWKNQAKNKDQVFGLAKQGQQIIQVSRDDLVNKIMVLDYGQSLQLSIVGQNKKGKIKIKDSSTIPILNNGKAVGTTIVKIEYK